MSGRKEIEDIRQVATQDEDAENDVWTWDLLVRWADSLNEKGGGHAG